MLAALSNSFLDMFNFRLPAVLFPLSRDFKKIEGPQFTLRAAQKKSQDSVRITDETALPMRFRRIEARVPGAFGT